MAPPAATAYRLVSFFKDHSEHQPHRHGEHHQEQDVMIGASRRRVREDRKVEQGDGHDPESCVADDRF